MTRFAKALRDEVRERGVPGHPVSQTAAAEELGVRSTRVNRWLKGSEPEPDAYCALVAFLHLDGLAALGELELLGRKQVFDECKTGSEE
jgi:hypothetical protein